MGTRQPTYPSGLAGVIFLVGGLGQLGLAGYLAFPVGDQPGIMWITILLIAGLGGFFTWGGIRGLMATDVTGGSEGIVSKAADEFSLGPAVVFTLIGLSAIGFSGFLAYWLNPTELSAWGGILFPSVVGSIFVIVGIAGIAGHLFGV